MKANLLSIKSGNNYTTGRQEVSLSRISPLNIRGDRGVMKRIQLMLSNWRQGAGYNPPLSPYSKGDIERKVLLQKGETGTFESALSRNVRF
jgi:hypothetical protein